MERPMVTAVTHSDEEARVTLAGVRNEPGVAGRIFTALAEANVNVDVIIQNEPVSTEHGADLSFTVARTTSREAPEAVEALGDQLRAGDDRRADRQGLDRRRRHAQPPRASPRRSSEVLGERGHQHRDDLHLADQDLLRDRLRSGSRRGPGAARGVRPRRRRDPPRGADRGPPPPEGRRASERLPRRSPRRDRRGRIDRSSRCSTSASSRSPSWFRSPPSARPASACRSPAARSSAAILTEESIAGLDLVISSAGGAVSAEWAPKLIAAGAVVIDNTSYWRMHDDVPLVVSEVNPEATDAHRGLIANPNCSTMQMVVPLKPILDAVGIERLVISTYQSVSGTGQRAIEELAAQSRALLAGERRRARASTRTRSPSTCCPRSRPSRAATTTPPRSAR